MVKRGCFADLPFSRSYLPPAESAVSQPCKSEAKVLTSRDLQYKKDTQKSAAAHQSLV